MAITAALALPIEAAGSPATTLSEKRQAGSDNGAGSAGPPNIVLIVIDALRADSLGCYGYSRDTSPIIDQLAERGTIFDRAFTVGGNTSTAMPAMMTGRLPFYQLDHEWNDLTKFGMHRFYEPGESGLPSSLPTLAEALSHRGYVTAGFITNPHLKASLGFDRGFDHYEELLAQHDPKRLYGTSEEVMPAVTRWLDSKPDGRFFAFIHLMDVHGPYAYRRACHKRFGYSLVQDRPGWKVNHEWMNKGKNIEADLREPFREHMKGNYDCEIAYADSWIGHLLEVLEQRDLLSTSVIAVTSDHGEEFLEHGGTAHRGALYDEIVRIPLVMAGPLIPRQRISALVRNFDLMPTFIELSEGAGRSDPPPAIDAVSLMPLISGARSTLDLDVYAGFPFDPTPGSTFSRMLRDETYKLIHRPKSPGRDELFDLDEDPQERHNLVLSKPEIHQALLADLVAIVAKLSAEGSTRTRPATLLAVSSPASSGHTWSPTDQSAIRAKGSSIEIAPTLAGRSPRLVTPALRRLGSPRPLLIRADVSIQEPTVIVASALEQSSTSSDRASGAAAVDSGRQTVYLELRAPEGTDRIELALLDPSPFTLHSIEVVGLDGRIEVPGPAPAEPGPGQEIMDEATKAQLRALGYVD